MNSQISTIDLATRLQEQAFQQLSGLYQKKGYWSGHLSSSALSTALAVFCLANQEENSSSTLVENGKKWLLQHANTDGGYGDTIDSPSNFSTSIIVYATLFSFKIQELDADPPPKKLRQWLQKYCSELSPEQIKNKLFEIYGEDRTFSAPILMLCALSGLFGHEKQAWSHVPQLPFELAILPRSFFKIFKLEVVSYALPALIAIGICRHEHLPSRFFLLKKLRSWLSQRCLRLMSSIQPDNGGFLEATPLTAFVTMSLESTRFKGHGVTKKGFSFIDRSARADGSWPIDSSLATWVSTLSIKAMSSNQLSTSPIEKMQLKKHLFDQQTQQIHPYTGASGGAWGWSHFPGSVPDADDTAGALLALNKLEIGIDKIDAIKKAIHWLIKLQNADGGLPTFCKGWGKLPFDRSCPDITAHVCHALESWKSDLPDFFKKKIKKSQKKMLSYLSLTQKENGAWAPLWFGDPYIEGEQSNTIYGTSTVLIHLHKVVQPDDSIYQAMLLRGLNWLAGQQQESGCFATTNRHAGSVEETTLAFKALDLYGRLPDPGKALIWLKEHFDNHKTFKPTPIGLYFASLWYSEDAYPLIFTLDAMNSYLSKRK